MMQGLRTSEHIMGPRALYHDSMVGRSGAWHSASLSKAHCFSLKLMGMTPWRRRSGLGGGFPCSVWQSPIKVANSLVMLSAEPFKLEVSKSEADGGDVQGSVEDVAAIASAAQPTGYTLATTTVHTKVRHD